MLMTVTPLPTPNDAGHPYTHPPPPLLPKPGKENIRLQKVLQKAAKKKNPPAAVAQPKAFRSTLSPVSEASPDLEHCERTPLPQPTTPRPVTPSFLAITLPPRFFIKPVVHHVSSPYPQHRSFTFTVTEQRSLSECLRRTPSPRPPSPSVKQVIPPLQLQQPPQKKTDGPRQGLIPSSPAHLSRPIPVIVEPSAPFVITPAPCTPVVEATVKEVYVNDAQEQLPEADSPREGCITLESVQNTSNRKEDNNSTMLCQSDSSSSMVSTTVTTLHITTNAPLPKSTHDAVLTHPPKNEPTIESAQGPKAHSIQLNTPSTSKDSSNAQPVSNTRPLTPKQQDLLTTENDAQTAQVTITSHNSISVAKTEVPPTPPVLPAKSEPTISEVPKSEPLLKSAEKVKPPRTKLSGWSRLKKHLVVEPEEPQFPVPESEAPKHIEGAAEDENKGGKDGDDKSLDNKPLKPKESRANKMWDALLYQMSSPKEEDKRKGDKEETGGKKEPSAKEEKPSFFFRCRLPLLLHRPRFDARKLREAASRPFKKITTMFDLGRLNRKAAEEEPKDFNRTASGWQLK